MATQAVVKTMDEIEALTAAKPVPIGAAEAFTDLLANATAAQEYTGNVPLLEKDRLVGVPMLITAYAVLTAEQGAIGGKDASYVFARCMLPNGETVGFTDGGSAIPPVFEKHAEAVGATEDGRELVFNSPLFCKRGLLRSDYESEEFGPATTFHLT